MPAKRSTLNLIGRVFGRLTVVDGPIYAVDIGGKTRARWASVCKCGGAAITRTESLLKGSATSCGCFQRENMSSVQIKHGAHNSALYSVWNSMKSRCLNVSHRAYANYGARGITVCDEWADFKPFMDWAMNSGYSKGLTLDRKDNNLGYAPENCRWVTQATNNNNRRSTPTLEAFGEKKSLSEWLSDARCVAGRSTIHRRILRGVHPELAITTPGRCQQ